MDNSQEQSLFNVEAPTQKIYARNAIYAATFLGGPLVGGYLLGENFKVFGELKKAGKAWVISIISTLIILGLPLLIKLPQNFPKFIIPFTYSYIAYLLVQKFQGAKIAQHLNSGGATYGFWRVTGVSILGGILTIALFLFFAFLAHCMGVSF